MIVPLVRGMCRAIGACALTNKNNERNNNMMLQKIIVSAFLMVVFAYESAYSFSVEMSHVRLQMIEDDDEAIHRAAISPAKNIFAMGTDNGKIVFFDARTGVRLPHVIQLPSRLFPIKKLKFSPDGRYLACIHETPFPPVSTVFYQYNDKVKAYETLYCFDSNVDEFASFVDFSPDSRFVGLAYTSGRVFVWDIQAARDKEIWLLTRDDFKNLVDEQHAFSTYLSHRIEHFSFQKSFLDLCFVVGSSTSGNGMRPMKLSFFEGSLANVHECSMGPVFCLPPDLERNSNGMFLADMLYGSLQSESDRDFIRRLDLTKTIIYYTDFFDDPALIMTAYSGNTASGGFGSYISIASRTNPQNACTISLPIGLNFCGISCWSLVTHTGGFKELTFLVSISGYFELITLVFKPTDIFSNAREWQRTGMPPRYHYSLSRNYQLLCDGSVVPS